MWLWLLFLPPTIARNASDPPEIVAVSAMCSSDGITASVDFDGAFNGKIYSLDYANIHDCLYYNALDMNTVLFSIPAHRCGTRFTRSTRNVVDQMVNRVYVQMDRDFQSSHDKQFSFVCQLADGRKSAEENSVSETRRAPQRDSYATPPPAAFAVTPVKALSTDARQFGNWPIPGAINYDPSMKPSPVIPRLPSSGLPVVPAGPVTPIRGLLMLYLVSSFLDLPRPLVPHRAPPMPQYPQAPVVPQKRPVTDRPFSQLSPPVVPKHPDRPVPQLSPPVIPKPPPIQSTSSLTSSDSYIRPPAYPLPQWPNNFAGSFQRAPIVPSRINKHQGIGMGLQPVRTDDEYTRVPAETWNRGTTEGYARGPQGQLKQQERFNGPSTTTSTETSTVVVKGKVFKEEPPRVGVAFTSDDNTLGASEVQPKEEVQDVPTVQTEFLVGRQDSSKPKPTDVFLEIQRGEGPFSSAVAGPVKIGENITLVVRSTTQMEGDQSFDMFVHSCFAADGPGTTRVDLTNEKGKEFVGDLNRLRNGPQQIYFFRIAAFKFPGPDDVYFSCSIDITPNKTAPEICSANGRRKRAVPSDQMRLFDIVKVELEEEWEKDRKVIESTTCISPSILFLLSSLILFLSLALLSVSYLAISQHFRLQKTSPGF